MTLSTATRRGLILTAVGALALSGALALATLQPWLPAGSSDGASRSASPSGLGWDSTEPAPQRSPLPIVPDTVATLPPGLGTGGPLRDPGWATTPQTLDGVFVGPREHPDGGLEYLAIDATGEPLWSARRPPSCTGFALSRTADGRGIAVLTDQRPSTERISDPVAAAYDLRTGEPIWGPTTVSGPHKGPGLVFAAPPTGFLGPVGAKVALDPSTGAVLHRDAELATERILAEHHGTVITISDTQLAAHTDEGTSWAISHAALGWDASHIANATRQHGWGPRLLALPTPGPAGEPRTAIIDLRTGTIVARDITGAAWDATTDTLVTLSGDAVSGHLVPQHTLGAAQGTDSPPPISLRWERPATADHTLLGAGGGHLFLRDGDRNTALTTLDGSAVPEKPDAPTSGSGTTSGPGPAAARTYIPALSDASGALAVRAGNHWLFAPRPG